MNQEINIPGSVKGKNIVIGNNEVDGKEYDGVHADGLMPEEGGPDTETISDEKGVVKEIVAKNVILRTNMFCKLELKNTEKLVVQDCFACTITIHTEDPRKITYLISGNDDQTKIIFLNPDTNVEIDLPLGNLNSNVARSEVDGNMPANAKSKKRTKSKTGSVGNKSGTTFQSGGGTMHVGGKVTGNKIVMGNDQIVTQETMGAEHAIGDRVLLPKFYGDGFSGGSFNGINLAGDWKLEVDEGKPVEFGGMYSYIRVS